LQEQMESIALAAELEKVKYL